jgi:ABC-2 type transport system permease protein
VLSASLYIIACSTRNRARQRLRRLREPRYLAGAVVGAAYLYFSFVARLRSTRSNPGRAARARRTRGGTPFDVPGLAATAPAFAGIALMGAAALSWLAPFESGLLEFSEAETQFLFPAPLTRRQLLVHRLLRSQLGLLFGAVVFGITVPSSSGYRRLWVGLAMWVLLVTGKIYFTAVSLTRARIRAASGAARVRAWLPAAIVIAAIAIVATALMRAFYAAPPSGIADIVALVGGVSQQPVPRVVLWPFVALVRPVFAASTAAYLPALASALAVLAAATLWMFRSDEVFHLAADEAARRRSRRSQGRPQVTYKARAEEWKLAPTGRPEAAFAWKALMQTLRVFNRREVVRTVAILTALTAVAAATNREGPAALLGGFAIAAAAFAILMAPQIVRIDMRQDLQHLELLKTWPVRGPSIVRGQLVWPAVMITAIAWTMLAVALTLSGIVLPRVGLVWRLASTGAVAILAPALVLAQLTVHNAVALMFPAWVPLGFQRARGLDAIGQRIIMLGGTWLLLIVMTIPGALAAGIFWLIVGRFFGPLMLIPAATAAAGVIAVEVLLATEALGPVYERLDVLAVERVE